MIVDAILVGRVRPFGPGGEPSAIVKQAVAGRRAIGPLGFTDDEQADLTVHGGIDKAIHHYPRDHYRWWRDRLGPLPVLDEAGAFGENISTSGMTEETVCIGDRYSVGSALLELCQGRQPCWKQAQRLADKGAIAAMVSSRRCGWYYRVVEGGAAGAGDRIELQSRPHPEWTVARVIGLLIGGDARRDPGAVRQLATIGVLAENWRARALALGGG